MRLATELLKDEKSARDNHVFACNFANFVTFWIFFTDWLSNKHFLIDYWYPHHTLNV